ncbi:hypothetical protein IPM62_01395 [Candidatus Woesebacteria bacterium]|nr:MAG: hypothetical protein IPM62_01395 [Candidatus Woesebacteria bacterium]
MDKNKKLYVLILLTSLVAFFTYSYATNFLNIHYKAQRILYIFHTARFVISENRTFSPINTSQFIKQSDYKNIQEVQYNITVSQGSVDITDTSESTYFVSTKSVRSPFGVSVHNKVNTDKLLINLGDDGEPESLSTPDSIKYGIEFGRQTIPVDLDFYAGKASVKSSFTNLNLRKFKFNNTFGSADFSFSSNSIPKETFEIETVSGKVSIALPEEIGVKVTYETIGSNSKLDETEFVKSGEYYSNNYKQSKIKLNIFFTTSTGHLFVRRTL